MRKADSRKSRIPAQRLTIAAVALCVFCTQMMLPMVAHLQDLTVTADFQAKASVTPNEKLEFKMNRAITASEGHIAVVIGRLDVTGLLVVATDTFAYTPKILPLPAGEIPVLVYVVSPDNTWKQIAQFTLRVEDVHPTQTPAQTQQDPATPQSATTSQSDGNAPQTTTPANGNTRKSAFDKAILTPSLTLGMKSQVAESHSPVTNRPPRQTFADATLQGSFTSDMARGLFNSQPQVQVVGSSFRQEALRFAQLRNNAPEIDLASYLMQFQFGKTKLTIGHLAFGANRFLVNNFSSRGIALTTPITNRGDFSIAAMNGTTIVGWSNFFGVERREHQIVTGTLGFEFLPKRPGGLRIETSVMEGRLLPLSGFNQGSVTDKETDHGLGFRLLASAPNQRWRIDGGYARSNFTNPADPLLYQGRDVVPVRAVRRDAHFLDASYAVLQNVSLSDTKKANLTVTYRRERVDPLFRSIAAPTQADREQNQLEAVAVVGDATVTFSHFRLHDNLADIPSILKTLSRRTNLNFATPLSSLLGNPAKPSPWLPRLSYIFDEFHQFGASIPVNGGFEVNPSTVPDQVSTNQNLTADWQLKRMRFGYHFNRSFQDNRQIGRESADLRNLVNGFTFGINPSAALDLNLEVNAENALNKEMSRTDQRLRLGSTINWRMTQKMIVVATSSFTGAGATGGVARNRNVELDLQWSYRWAMEKSRFKKVQGQFFIRYANRYARSRDSLFQLDNLLKLQTLNLGLNFTFF